MTPRWLRQAALAAAVLGGGTGPAALAQAQPAATPDTQQMIEALKPSAQRSRNLLVRPAAEPVAPAVAAASSPAPAPAPASPSLPATPAVTAPPAAATPAPGLSLPIQFEPNSAQVRPESGPLLGELVAAMISPELRDSRFRIEGHTDARGSAAANRRLSQARAEEVRQYLILLGVHAARLQAVGKGSSEPANAADPMAAENRRVRVVTLE